MIPFCTRVQYGPVCGPVLHAQTSFFKLKNSFCTLRGGCVAVGAKRKETVVQEWGLTLQPRSRAAQIDPPLPPRIPCKSLANAIISSSTRKIWLPGQAAVVCDVMPPIRSLVGRARRPAGRARGTADGISVGYFGCRWRRHVAHVRQRAAAQSSLQTRSRARARREMAGSE